ncbi:hypothetical protein [Dactylosporangium sp. NPDC049140]|uniref:hypothetical protein n=1 Tax=Dactylosporangium sp. NPDC049140 TaxID=3155647 RepID=UPI0033E268A9
MNDDELLSPLLRRPELPPSKVDIERALRSGRRRERGRRLLAVAAAAIAVGVTVAGIAALGPRHRAAPPAHETPRPTAPSRSGCSVHRLPTPGDRPATVDAVDPDGRYAVGTLDGADDSVMVWAAGVLQVLEGTPRPNASPVAVNASGVVVGNAGDEAAPIPWMLKDHVFTALAWPPGAQSVTVAGINAAGDIAGTATWEQNGQATKARIVRWNAARPDVVTYVTSNPAVAVAAAIGADGTIAGLGRDGASGDTRAYLWAPDGTPRALERSPGRPALGATGIAGDWVIGYYEDGSTWFNQGLRWNLRTGEVRELGDFAPGAIDTSGRMFGSLMRGADETPPARWKDGKTSELPVLSAGQSAVVTSASADGRLVAGRLQRAKNDPVVPVRWSCA